MSDLEQTRRPGTNHPHLARERALKVLFAADVRGVDPRLLLDQVETRRGALELLDELEPDEEQVAGDSDLQVELTRRRRLPLDEYTRTLVAGVAQHRAAIDALLGDVAARWSVARMPAVDRNLLRLAIYEMVEQDTPHAVVIDEAVSLAGGFAGEKARPFVNGVLETVRKAVAAGDVAFEQAVVEPADDLLDDAGADVDDSDDDNPFAFAEPEDVDEAAEAAYDLALELLESDEDVALLDEVDEDDELSADAIADALVGSDAGDGDDLW